MRRIVNQERNDKRINDCLTLLVIAVIGCFLVYGLFQVEYWWRKQIVKDAIQELKTDADNGPEATDVRRPKRGN